MNGPSNRRYSVHRARGGMSHTRLVCIIAISIHKLELSWFQG